MRRVLFAFVVAFVVAVVLAVSALTAAGQQDFILINKTGLVIDELYVSPTSVNDWEEDVLGVDTLANDASAHVSFSREETECLWDLKIVDEEGDAVEWKKIDLCKAEEITLFYRNHQPTAQVR